MLSRRDFLTLSAVFSLAPFAVRDAQAVQQHSAPPEGQIKFGPKTPFSFEALIARARDLQNQPYKPKIFPPGVDQMLDALDYDALGAISVRNSATLLSDGPGLYPINFFHMGRLFKTPMHIYLVDGNHEAREVLYAPSLFFRPPESPANNLPDDIGFAGFRLQESRLGPPNKRLDDWVSFLGASYFRAIGDQYQYGLSARGIAVNTGLSTPEEFPAFTQAYIQSPTSAKQDFMDVALLLEGPSVVGAYRFRLHRTEAVVMDVEAHLFCRQDMERFGIAPLTSMYWFSETLKTTGINWRPEVHDSDGLALWTESGERIWRPLNNPPHTAISIFSGTNIRGFGLMQRDRTYDHYLDNVHYERRPSLWITPKKPWGQGSVTLVEIPTNTETNDNIVAYWTPEKPAKKGDVYHFDYTLRWAAHPKESLGEVAICTSTHFQYWEDVQGNNPLRYIPNGGCAFHVGFSGKALAALSAASPPKIIVSTSRGTIRKTWTQMAENPGSSPTWFAYFTLDDAAGEGPVELRLFLQYNGQPLTETWLYQYWPHSP